MAETNYVKNLGQVSALVYSSTEPSVNYVLWYDLNTNTIKYYDLNLNEWTLFTPPISGAKNLESDGEGLVFKELEGTVLAFRRIKAGKGIKVSTGENDITIELSDFLEISPLSLDFPSTIGASLKLRVSSNLSWQLIVPPDLVDSVIGWLSFDKLEGYGYAEITITVTKENPDVGVRTSSLILRDILGDLEDKQISVSQDGGTTFQSKFVLNSNDLQCELTV